jgi:hypothetical protein
LQQIYPLVDYFPCCIVHKMSIFQRLRGSTDEPELSPELRKRLAELDERQRLQEKGLKLLEMEWQEWFDKFRLMYARLSKRIKDAAEADGNGAQSREDAPRATKDRLVGYGHPPLHDVANPSRRNY